MTRQARYPKEEFARRGDELYEQLLPQLADADRGRILAIDIETGEYEIADEVLAATHALLARRPQAQIACRRIGLPAVYRFGPRRMPD
jgi:hypothetical protein